MYKQFMLTPATETKITWTADNARWSCVTWYCIGWAILLFKEYPQNLCNWNNSFSGFSL